MDRIVAAHELYLKDDSAKLVNIKPKVRAVIVAGDVQESYNKLVRMRGVLGTTSSPHLTSPHLPAPRLSRSARPRFSSLALARS